MRIGHNALRIRWFGCLYVCMYCLFYLKVFINTIKETIKKRNIGKMSQPTSLIQFKKMHLFFFKTILLPREPKPNLLDFLLNIHLIQTRIISSILRYSNYVSHQFILIMRFKKNNCFCSFKDFVLPKGANPQSLIFFFLMFRI